ncbi:hypothetical protein GRI89_14575 [Altererythrobacter salegens]|uniref:Lipoprotein n=1 Tax=Croceibacterium salegens TaxID=1737568 RepID=A0A6I4SXL8_9SPHN|nr:hypothetical protein [Croceibacterium salegens]MXO60765.1 hypothetical protein [Croceibacterium salegens]
MKKFAISAIASAAFLALAACGSADDASEDAMADNVEMPADEALSEVPAPVADETAAVEDASSDVADTTSAVGDAAEAAANDAVAAAASAASAAN